jgi:predicted membrane channel-forming protein YqfA (hemolysin III family)
MPTDETAVGLVAIGLLVVTLVGWFFAFRDLLRRDDARTSTKIVWGVLVVVLGIVGVVLYFLFRPRGATATERAAEQQRSDEFVARYTQQQPTVPADEREVQEPPAG